MFTKRTIKPKRRVTSVDTPSEALAMVDFVLPFGYNEEKAMKGEQHEHHSQYLLFRQKRICPPVCQGNDGKRHSRRNLRRTRESAICVFLSRGG